MNWNKRIRIVKRSIPEEFFDAIEHFLEFLFVFDVNLSCVFGLPSKRTKTKQQQKKNITDQISWITEANDCTTNRNILQHVQTESHNSTCLFPLTLAVHNCNCSSRTSIVESRWICFFVSFSIFCLSNS